MAGGGHDPMGENGALTVDASLLDPVSGLYAQPFFLASVELRMVACRRALRPLTLAFFEVVEGLPQGPVLPTTPRLVATVLRATLRTSDVAGRLGDGAYGLLLEGTPQDDAIRVIERLRRGLATRVGGRTLRCGVAGYPGHALTPAELVQATGEAFTAARRSPYDRIELAAPAI